MYRYENFCTVSEEVCIKSIIMSLENQDIFLLPPEKIRELFKNGLVSPFSITSFGWPLIHEAVFEGEIEKVCVLLEFGVDVNTQSDEKDEDPRTPLEVAVFNTHPYCRFETVKFLLENGADPNIVNPVTGESVLQLACRSGSIAHDIIELLVNYGADPLHNDYKNMNALSYSIFYRDVRTANLLVEQGASSDANSVVDNLSIMQYAEQQRKHLVPMLSGELSKTTFSRV